MLRILPYVSNTCSTNTPVAGRRFDVEAIRDGAPRVFTVGGSGAAVLSPQYQWEDDEPLVRTRVRARWTGRRAPNRVRIESYTSVVPDSSTTETRSAKGILVGELSRAPLRRAT